MSTSTTTPATSNAHSSRALSVRAKLDRNKVGRALRAAGPHHLQRLATRYLAEYDLLMTPTLPTEALAAAGPPPAEINGRPIGDILDAVVFTYPFQLERAAGCLGARRLHGFGPALRATDRGRAPSRGFTP